MFSNAFYVNPVYVDNVDNSRKAAIKWNNFSYKILDKQARGEFLHQRLKEV